MEVWYKPGLIVKSCRLNVCWFGLRRKNRWDMIGEVGEVVGEGLRD